MVLDIRSLAPRQTVSLGLLALLPVIGYAIGRPSLAGFVAAFNVVLIVGSLYIAMSPVANDPISNGETNDGTT